MWQFGGATEDLGDLVLAEALTGSQAPYVLCVLWRDPGQLMFLGTSDSGLRGLGRYGNLEWYSLWSP